MIAARACTILVAACLCLATRPAAAATIVVNSTADTRADDGVCTLREAIIAANTNTASGPSAGECEAGSALPTIDMIELSNVSGSPDLFTLAIAGRDEDAATTGDLDLTESVTVRGQAMTESIVQAGTSTANGIDRVFDVVQGGVAIAVAFEKLTIRHGLATVPAGGVAASAQGGGVYLRAVLSGLASAVTVTDASITLNTAAGNGGGIAVAGGFGAIAPSLTLLRSDVSSNTSSLGGGGILCSACTLAITNSSVLSNTAQVTGGLGYGGGGLRITGDGLSSTITNSTIGDNRSNTDGGGAVIPVGTATAQFTFATLYSNRADFDASLTGNGGALRNVTGTMQVNRSIVAGNLRGVSVASDCSGVVSSLGYNVLGTSGSCVVGGTATVTTADAKLSTLDFHGGTTRNYAPIVASPALARIPSAQCSSSTDQRGFVRPIASACESGAIENSRPTVVANDASMLEDGGPQGFPFTVADFETLDTLIVSATSSVAGLVPNGNMAVTGSGANRTLTVTPLTDQSGSSQITVTADDGDAPGTDPFTLTVLSVNDAPTLAALPTPVTIAEDAATQTVNLSGINAGGGESQTLTVTATSDNTALIPHPTAAYSSPNATGSISYTPVADANGSATITVTVTDNGGGTDSVSRSFVVNVTTVNDAPTLAALPTPVTIAEDAGTQTVNLSGISAGGGESQTLTVTATSDNTALIPHPTVTYTSANATGSISYAPVADANGSATITMTVTDNGSGTNSVSRTFVVNVTAVNDPPTLAALPTQVTIAQDAAMQTVNLSGISAGGGETQTLTVTATSDNTALIPHPTVTYTSANATGSISYTPVAAAHGSATITVTVTDNGGGTNSVTRTFVVNVTDTTAPAAPTALATTPASPANDNSPKLLGNAEAGSTVRVYTSNDCSGSAVVTGSASAFSSPGLTVSVTDDSSTTFKATATDAAGNTSSCSSGFTYTEDSSAPSAPSIASSSPSSPANDNSPELLGSAEAGSTVRLYTSSDCSGSAVVTGSASAFNSPGLTVAVANDSSTTFRATATDAAGNTSACSSGFSYTEDSTPPIAPTIQSSSPSSPANDNSPKLLGNAEAGSTVRVYTSNDCSGSAVVTGSASAFSSPGLTVAVANDSSTTFRATATDAAGNTSSCSSGVSYTEDSSAPSAPSIDSSSPASPANDNSPELIGSAELNSIVKLYTSSDCTGPIAAQGTASAFSSPGLTVAVANGTSTTFRATATDAAGNTSACSSGFSYTATIVCTIGCFTDQPLAAGVGIKVVHITELRTRIDTLRAQYDLPQMTWTDPTLVAGVTVARTEHLIDLRNALVQAYQAARLTPPTFTDPTLTPAQTAISVVHISELRSAVIALEGS